MGRAPLGKRPMDSTERAARFRARRARMIADMRGALRAVAGAKTLADARRIAAEALEASGGKEG